jgi:hypothetical protein
LGKIEPTLFLNSPLLFTDRYGEPLPWNGLRGLRNTLSVVSVDFSSRKSMEKMIACYDNQEKNTWPHLQSMNNRVPVTSENVFYDQIGRIFH